MPLVLAFAGLGMLILDLRHPVRETDQCQLVGRGALLKPFKAQTPKILYKRTIHEAADIGFQCKKYGNILVNDDIRMVLDPGQPVELVIKRYKWVPTQYHFQVPVVTNTPAHLN
ncbi:MAG: hypothetical protein R2857_10555 [Vampirovibrionales bacterium]